MSNVGRAGRSFKHITQRDLRRLAALASADRIAFFSAHRDWARFYSDRLVAVALCQGAALHFLDGSTGVQDFDVYSFFARHPKRHWYAKRNKHVDFGNGKFGTSPDKPAFVGRRVDLMGRSLDVPLKCDPAAAIRGWLEAGRPGESAAYLAKKAVILLWPPNRLGEVVWPPPLPAAKRRRRG